MSTTAATTTCKLNEFGTAGRAYDRIDTGDHYVYLGHDSDGDFVFVSAFHCDVLELSKPKALKLFDPDNSLICKLNEFSEALKYYKGD